MVMQLEYRIDLLNSLLRGELYAVDVYEDAVTRFAGETQEATLRRILNDHIDASVTLHSQVIEQGGEPTIGSGPWGYFTAAVNDTSMLLHAETILPALRRGEEQAVKAYAEALANVELPEESLRVLDRDFLQRSRMHMHLIDQMIANGT
ncbi:MAG: PA2169 family four-helix-bundle protein [Planctomycetes bacterium]|nr:PA2169 family four-helix-bundle protein [Planctomycetota bacterium]